MHELENLSHSEWKCKYHVVFMPNASGVRAYRRPWKCVKHITVPAFPWQKRRLLVNLNANT